MTTWNEFYNEIKDPAWPQCDQEENFSLLPQFIQEECVNVFGYAPGAFKKFNKKAHKVFPIKTETACQLKWNWSTVYLTTGKTASCHRTNSHKLASIQNFHNTPEKINDRKRMLQGLWPEKGCEYCKNIEKAGGQSDRITNLDLQGMHAPLELDTNPNATSVTPRILEVYFDNTCNLKCVYCGPHFSSLWDAENTQFGDTAFAKDCNIEANKVDLFKWITDHRQQLDVLNILGGEPLYQKDTTTVLEILSQYPAPELKLQVFTNLNATLSYLQEFVSKVKTLVDSGKIREFEITASLDCWGDSQEYSRYPLKLQSWEENFKFLISQSWINLIINSTITPLTIKTLPELLTKINTWRQDRTIYHYQNSVNSPQYMFIDMFGDIFAKDFELALNLKPETTPEEIASKNYLLGIAKQASSSAPSVERIQQLFIFLNKIDLRRGTSWKHTFPWLINEFKKYNLE